jgi:NTE family protein
VLGLSAGYDRDNVSADQLALRTPARQGRSRRERQPGGDMVDPAQASAEHKTGARPRQALVLSGGDVRGAYQAGAIAEILASGFRPSAVFGISVGSINGGMLASYVGQQFLDDPNRKEADLPAAGEKLKNFWLKKIKTHTDIAKIRNRFLIVLEVIFKNFHGMLDVNKSIGIIRTEIQRRNLKLAAEKANLKFYAGTLNLTTGKYEDVPYDDCDIIDYIIASSMAPLMMPLWVIGAKEQPMSLLGRWRADFREWRLRRRPDHVDRDECWLDGGIHNNAPVSAAIEEGYDDIVCVLCRPQTIGRGSFQGRLGRIGKRIADVGAQQILEDDIQWAMDVQSLLDCLAQGLTEEDFAKYKGKTKFDKYRNFKLRVVRPLNEIHWEAETLEKGAVPRMVGQGVQDARAKMSGGSTDSTAGGI